MPGAAMTWRWVPTPTGPRRGVLVVIDDERA
jgi:hypothetical protein